MSSSTRPVHALPVSPNQSSEAAVAKRFTSCGSARDGIAFVRTSRLATKQIVMQLPSSSTPCPACRDLRIGDSTYLYVRYANTNEATMSGTEVDPGMVRPPVTWANANSGQCHKYNG